MSCGWAELPLSSLKVGGTQYLEIKGGTPLAAVELGTVSNERSGFRYFTQLIENSGSRIEL
jgi:hypothetical protein